MAGSGVSPCAYSPAVCGRIAPDSAAVAEAHCSAPNWPNFGATVLGLLDNTMQRTHQCAELPLGDFGPA
jgi:hypothetical protein